MKKASWSLMFVLLATVASTSYAQRDHHEPRRHEPAPIPQYPTPLSHYEERFPQEEILSERIQRTLRIGERLRLAEVLRSRSQGGEIVSLTIAAQSFRGQVTLSLMDGYSTIEMLQVRRQIQDIPVRASQLGQLQMLELSANEEIYIESITATIRSHREPQYERELQVSPYTLITLRVNQDVVNGEIPLKRLVKEQLGLSLEGAQIERIAVEGMPIGRAAPSVHVELNNRIASQVKYLSTVQRRTPLQITSFEEVRSLRLVVSGPARIMDINIRIGAVRSSYNPAPIPSPYPMPIPSSRILVNQEVSPSYPLDLAQFARGYSVVRSLTLETTIRGYNGGEITLMGRLGQIVGRGYASQGRTTILLTIPTPLSDIRIYTQSQIFIGSIE